MEKSLSVHMFTSDAAHAAVPQPCWELWVRDSRGGAVRFVFRPFASPPGVPDERDNLWEVYSVGLMGKFGDELDKSTNLVKRIHKLSGFGLWHMLPHELIKRGYRPHADQFPAKYAPA